MTGFGQRSIFADFEDGWYDDTQGENFRYRLGRSLEAGCGRLLWILLNPSTARAGKHDATTKRVEHFTRAWGFGAWEIVNPIPYSASSPEAVVDAVWTGAVDVLGPLVPVLGARINEIVVDDAVVKATAVVVGWGTHAEAFPEIFGRFVDRLLQTRTLLWCVGTTKSGHPRHPCRGIPNDTRPQLWRPVFPRKYRRPCQGATQ